MRTRHRSFLTDCKGTAAIEFALVGPTFLLLLLFIVQASFLLWTKSAVQAVASQTARCTAVGAPGCADPQAFATLLMNGWGVAGFVSTINVTVTPGSTCNNAAGRFSSVTVSSPASGFIDFVPSLSGIILTGTACYPSAT